MAQEGDGEYPRWKDLPTRAWTVLGRLQTALDAGELDLPAAQRQLVQSELGRLGQVFRNREAPSTEPGPSVLPISWLQARWQLAFPRNRCWYAYLPDGTNITFTTNKEKAGYQDKLAQAQEEGLFQGGTFVDAVVDKPDALMELPFVRKGRERLLQKGQKKVKPLRDQSHGTGGGGGGLDVLGIGKALLAGGVTGDVDIAYAAYAEHQYGQNAEGSGAQAPATLAKELRLLVDFERLKFSMNVELTAAGKGARLHAERVKGVDPYSAACAVHLQRLALLLLWLLHGKNWKYAQQGELNYVSVEESLQDLGWSEWTGHPDWSESGRRAWQELRTAVEEHLEERGEEFSADGEMRGWRLREKGFLGIPRLSRTAVVMVERLQAENLAAVVDCLEEGGFGRLLVIVDALDGPTARRLTRLLADGKPVALAVNKGGLCAGDAEALISLGKLYDEMGQPCPKYADDLLLAAAPVLGLADPLLGPCWLGLQSLKHVKEIEKLNR